MAQKMIPAGETTAASAAARAYGHTPEDRDWQRKSADGSSKHGVRPIISLVLKLPAIAIAP
jgi:hypothetical protein